MRQGSPAIVLALFACLALAAPAGAADPLRHHQWGLGMIGADPARATTDGAGATVAVIDSGGALGHPDLQGRLVAGPDFVDDDGNPADGNGHGTHVAGIVAANTGNGIGVESVAPGVRVLVVRVLDDDGAGTMSDVVAGIRWATDHGADVINLSLGPEVPLAGSFTGYDEAVQRAVARGIVVVAAAGNGLLGLGASLPLCDQPSAQEGVLCVGAVDRNGSRAIYSNFGLGLGITAPGGAGFAREEDDILSTSTVNTGLGPYEWIAGTSQATPHVAGVAALLVSLGVRGSAATRRILATARDAGTPGPDPVYGAGIVDARAAVAGLRRPDGGGGAGGGAGAGGGGSTGSGTAAPGASTRTGAAARVSLARTHRLRTVLRRGIRVACTAAGTGRCRVNVNAARRRLATGSRFVRIGRRTIVTARLTRRGRLLARSALRRRRAFRATVFVYMPGTRALRRTIRLRP